MNALLNELYLDHPGPRQVPRIKSVPAQSRGVFTRIESGRRLLDHLVETLHEMGTDSGFAELHGGRLSPVSYCVPRPGDGVHRLVSYSETRGYPNANLVLGSATIGTRHGQPFMHCHSYWTEVKAGTLGGHLWPETAAGTEPPFAAVYGLFGAEWTSDDDPETNMPVFTPRPSKERGMPGKAVKPDTIPTTVARVLPNEDITEAVERLCLEAGYRQAVVRAGIGSLVGAVFVDRATGEQRHVDGPGTEVISLVGHVKTSTSESSASLTCTLVDQHGVVHAGELVPGWNPVSVTFELIIQEIN